MKSQNVVILNETGLHARPAKEFVNLAKTFDAEISVLFGEKKAKGKSLISLLTLGVAAGSQITLIADGVDEEQAIESLVKAVHAGLGEGSKTSSSTSSKKEPCDPPANSTKQSALSKNTLVGIGVAKGIAIGQPFHYKRKELPKIKEIKPATEEIALLRAAIQEVAIELENLRESLKASGAEDEMAIFDVHIELLEDVELIDTVEERIKNFEENAAQAWQKVIESRAIAISKVEDELLAARATDIHDVGYRVLRVLVGDEENQIELPDHPVIICAQDLTPSDTVLLKDKDILGFCTAAGGPTSHTAIIARALGMPAVVSLGEKILTAKAQIILDGYAGHVHLEPTSKQINAAQKKEKQQISVKQTQEKNANQPAITKDGHQITVAANIGNLSEARIAKQRGAEGIGLLRTEFIFIERKDPPQEGEQYQLYKQIAETMGEHGVVIRTLDVGGDKPLSYVPMPKEENPFLGIRGIRLSLSKPEILTQQLQEIFKAAPHGNLKIMFPMVSDFDEWLAIKAQINKLELPKTLKYELGIMVEVPSTAILADQFAKEVDFFSIGTNDLTQYTLAMDRMHPQLACKSDGLHPAILRMIDMTVKAAHKQEKWVGVCGELGADLTALPILVGLDVDEVSVNVQSIPEVKAAIRNMHYQEVKNQAQQALSCQTAKQVRALIEKEKVQS